MSSCRTLSPLFKCLGLVCVVVVCIYERNERYCTVAGGLANTAKGPVAFIGGGMSNVAEGNRATVGGGWANTANGFQSTVAGGQMNTATGLYSTIIGGISNTASGDFASTLGGSCVFDAIAGSVYRRACWLVEAA